MFSTCQNLSKYDDFSNFYHNWSLYKFQGKWREKIRLKYLAVSNGVVSLNTILDPLVVAPDDLGILNFRHIFCFFHLWKILSKMRIKKATENNTARMIKATMTVLISIGVPESVSGFRQSIFLELDLVHLLIIFLITPFWYNFESLRKNCIYFNIYYINY